MTITQQRVSIRDLAPAQFRFLTADEWGMTWKRPAVPEKLNDPEAYVHHTAGSRLGQDAVKAFQALNRWAQEGKNYSALDYDVLVHRATLSGLVTIGAGRGEWMSAATRDRNELGEAVCVMGYFHPGHVLSEHPHPDEVEGAALAIVWGMENGWISPAAVILGHYENPSHPGATGCPGEWFIPHMPTVRTRVAFWLAELAAANTPTEKELAMRVIQVTEGLVRDEAQYLQSGQFAEWLRDGTEKQDRAAELGFDPKPVSVTREFLGSLTLVGQQPNVDGAITSADDFLRSV